MLHKLITLLHLFNMATAVTLSDFLTLGYV